MNNRYFEISDKYASVVASCFFQSNGSAIYTFLDGTTKRFKTPGEAEKWISENIRKLKSRRRK